jgi:hypothetical protein
MRKFCLLRLRVRMLTTLAAVLAIGGIGLGCSGAPTATSASPTPLPAPTSPPSGLPEVSGTVWLHAPGGTRPYGNVPLGGWMEVGLTGSWRWGTVDGRGRYTLPAPDDARVRVQVAAGPSRYQPCAVTVEPGDRGSRDVHVIEDLAQLGARLPSHLLEQLPLLSGVVTERLETGQVVPLEQARITLDALGGLGVVAATTLADADGRYVLCGLDPDRTTYLFASKDGYELVERPVAVNDNTTLDIEMRRMGR